MARIHCIRCGRLCLNWICPECWHILLWRLFWLGNAALAVAIVRALWVHR